jgi:hypothetical protein
MEHALPVFDRNERVFVRDVIRRVRRDPYGDSAREELPLTGAPEVVMAKIPSLGIPPMSVPEDGTYRMLLGKAECELFYLERDYTKLIGEDGTLDITADIEIKPILSPIIDEQLSPPAKPPTKEWIYNPYRWRHYGKPAAATAPENPSLPVTMFTMAYRERTGFFVCTRPPSLYKAKTLEDILPDSKGYANVYQGGVQSGFAETVWLNWMHGGEKVSAGRQVTINYFEDERKWVIINAECENI